ncbi:MAG: 50S ribosomal protein L11 methyltransferase [Clostridia bacterium]|nr:50S ribosomal protein L11 methyltransferase [Clostridia bacterium]
MENTNWIQIRTTCKAEDVEAVCAVMCMINNGLMIEDYSDVDGVLDGVYGDLIDEALLNADRTRSAVSLFVPESASPAETELMLKDRFATLGMDVEVGHSSVCEEDWAESWKKYFKPIRTGNRVVIVPVWEKYDAAENDVVVLMDPGMAFGTGTHETTRLCAALLENYVEDGCRMIDVGCGSGILAICASKLGAGYCYACDIDPYAIKVARENVELNSCENITCEVSDLVREVDPASANFDVAAVNIVADVIIRLAPDIGRFLKDTATLIVSGIIVERAEETVAVLNAAGFKVVEEKRENGWFAAALKKA